jgi:predicted unusual protein kinase regulating ubiquinone biosynthesis (AarF/ABC1/UbiB family)
MEYIEGVPINNPDGIQAMGISLQAVSKLISRAFGELIFTFGDVHCANLCGMHAVLRRFQSS